MVIDERDTIFSRMALPEGSNIFDEYYSINPDKRDTDNVLRSLPALGSPESPTWDPMGSALTDSIFSLLSDMRPLSEGEPSRDPVETDPERLNRWVLGAASYLGADDAGIAAINPDLWYSHRGRREESWGSPVKEDHPYAVAIISAMDPSMIHKGPLAPVMAESARGYLRSGVTAIALACGIREMGYNARAHTDGNYLVVAPRVAFEAGLGVFGRSGLLIHRRFGPCARISVVTTDMPLLPGHPDPSADAVKNFCSLCGRCSKHCPGRAIPEGTPDLDKSVPWPLDAEKCYGAWRKMGTDCGVCISTCPFTAGLDWDELEEAKDDAPRLESILEMSGGKGSPRLFDPDPPQWWR
ncbi:MAG TPA: hypothetical protein ENN89_05040 [Synergistetes bacterium]|nr:hypothetical protein [Synergistota bacterium]